MRRRTGGEGVQEEKENRRSRTGGVEGEQKEEKENRRRRTGVGEGEQEEK